MSFPHWFYYLTCKCLKILFLFLSSSGGGSRSSSKRPRTTTEEDEDEEDLTAELDDPPPENAISEVKVTSANAGKSDMQPNKPGVASSYMDVDEAQDSQGGGGRSSSAAAGDRGEQDKEDNDDNVTEQTHHIIVPSYSSWFNYNAIHAIEKRALPEFFNGKNKSKTPEIYLSYRNFMIDSYR